MQPSSELQTKHRIFQLSPFPDYMSHALLVYMWEICSTSVTSSSQALSDAVLLMSNEVSAWGSTRELLGRGGQLWPVHCEQNPILFSSQNCGKHHRIVELNGHPLAVVHILYLHLFQDTSALSWVIFRIQEGGATDPVRELSRSCNGRYWIKWLSSMIPSPEQGQSRKARTCLVVAGRSMKELKSISGQ